ncbi:MAG TPA: glycosyltransferase family 1 protein [Vicinamibacterales bacterium]|nr:glycosyltransferase family 1 protein [Vicinamibacterales bacterium]
MRIAIDARELCGRPTGVGRYLAGLLEAWGDNATAQRHQWTLYAHTRPVLSDRRWDSQLRVVDGGGGTLWEQLSLPRALAAERPDVFFAPGYTAPLTVAAPLVLTVHDVSFFAHPEWFSFREGARRRLLTAWSARRGRKVITDSEFSKSEITRHIGIDGTRITVIPLGIDRPHSGSRLPAPGSREPIVLYVGSIFERRRVDQLIAAFDIAAAQVADATLEIVGENRTRRPRLDLDALRSGTRHPDRIHIRSYVNDETLRSLYQKATVLAFLSEYEGFGFTPLEALAAGVTPLVLDTPIARETCADAARYVPPAAPPAHVAQLMTELLTSAPARREILERAGTVLSRYDWDLAAGDTLKVLEEAALAR